MDRPFILLEAEFTTISLIKWKNLYLDEVGDKWWSNIAEEDEAVWVHQRVLARKTSQLDNRNKTCRKYYKASILLCNTEDAGPWLGLSLTMWQNTELVGCAGDERNERDRRDKREQNLYDITAAKK